MVCTTDALSFVVLDCDCLTLVGTTFVVLNRPVL